MILFNIYAKNDADINAIIYEHLDLVIVLYEHIADNSLQISIEYDRCDYSSISL